MPFLLRDRRLWILLVTVLMVAASCARQPEPSASLPPDDLVWGGQLAGFLVGLFHGFTMVFSIIASLFIDIRIYAFPNSGRLYDLGYVLGAAAFFSGASTGHRRSEADHWHRRSTVRDSERLAGDTGVRL